MSYTVGQYQRLQDVIASGAEAAHYGDKNLSYRKLKELLKILDLMKAELYPHNRPVRHQLAVHDKGVYPSNDQWRNEFI